MERGLPSLQIRAKSSRAIFDRTATIPLVIPPSTPLSVTAKAGLQQEKFLFYRGVSAAPLPLSAAQNASGDLEIRSLDRSDIPAHDLVPAERRPGRLSLCT